jgi:hypothetical protein
MSYLDPRQVYADDLEASQTEHDARQSQIHTAMPGVIVSYNAATMTAVVQPALQGMRTMMDGTRQPVTISPIQDVPVHFPGGGGHIFTFPVAAGDECLIIFSERSIDNWHQHGSVQQPSDWRMHDINDAFVMVGTRAQPAVPQAVDPNTVQMRSDDKMTLVQIDGKNKTITLYATSVPGGGDNQEAVVFVDGANNAVTLQSGTASVLVDGQGREVTLKTPYQVTLDAPMVIATGDIHAYGEIIAQSQTMGYVTLSKHWKHSGSPSTPTPGT